jgi:hypothetical protein
LVGLTLKSPKAKGPAFGHAMHSALQLGGVDTSGGMIVSAVHDERDVAQTVEAFDQALGRLQAEDRL